jgi:iodotyrosine deiodinase
MHVSSAIRMRRSARRFSPEALPKERLREVLEAGRLAPSGANRQPWHYVVVDDLAMKKRIRRECESADRKWWKGAPLWFLAWARSANLSRRKSFLEEAPFLILVF